MSTCTVDSKHEDVCRNREQWALIVHPEFPISPPSAHYFPEDKVPLLLQYLDAKEVCTVAQVNKYWQLLAMQDGIWSNLCKSDFHTDVNSFVRWKSRKESPGSMSSAKALYADFARAKQAHLRQVTLSHRAEVLQQRFNIQPNVALQLLTKYASS